jgi:hypothetical protein
VKLILSLHGEANSTSDPRGINRVTFTADILEFQQHKSDLSKIPDRSLVFRKVSYLATPVHRSVFEAIVVPKSAV